MTSRLAYANRWMRVREDVVERSDGSRGVYGVVEKPDFALIVPRDEYGFWLVEQFRYPVGRRFWEFPQGSWEASSGVEPAALARGELEEEAGLRAGSLQHVGRLYEAYGYCEQAFDVWLATDLEAGSARRGVEEQDMRAMRVSFEDWRQMIRRGEVMDAPSLAAFGLLSLTGD